MICFNLAKRINYLTPLVKFIIQVDSIILEKMNLIND